MRNAVVVVLLALVAGLVASESAQAQGTLTARKIQGPPKRISIGSNTSKSAPLVVYSNTIPSGYFSTPGTNEEWIDHAVITGNGDHDTITGLEFGYATYATGGPVVDARVRIYDGYTGFCGFLPGPAADVSLTGLPSCPSGVICENPCWIISLDLTTMGACFFLDNGPFGYSVAYSDSGTGPLLSSGGTGNLNRFDWTPSAVPTCGSWWFGGNPWAGFHFELTGHDGNDTFAGGCGGGLGLEITGPVCQDSTIDLTVTGESGAFWAFGLGTTIGAGVGGSLNGCPIDVIPIGGIRLMGRLPASTITFPANMTFGSGLSVGIQLVSKGTAPVWDSSNTEILHVP